jgi:hypothetical protein
VYRKDPYWMFFSSTRGVWEISFNLDSVQYPIWREYDVFPFYSVGLYSPTDVFEWQVRNADGSSLRIFDTDIYYNVDGADVACAPSPPSPPTTPPSPLPPSPLPPVPPPAPPPPLHEMSTTAGRTIEDLIMSGSRWAQAITSSPLR